jgi:flagellar assembly factor FliW
MKANTRLFGTIDIEDNKVITLEHGMIGFPDDTHFVLIYDKEKEEKERFIMWLQSMDDAQVAFPVLIPTVVKEDYRPTVNEEMLEPLGDLTEENTYMLVTVTVPKEVEKFSANLKAPIVINTDTQKGVQLIVEDDYPIKYPIYEALQAKKERAGE